MDDGKLKINKFQSKRSVRVPQTNGGQSRTLHHHFNMMQSIYPVFYHFKMKVLNTFHLRSVHTVFASFESSKSMLYFTLHNFSFLFFCSDYQKPRTIFQYDLY